MKKIFGLIAALVLISGCDDGDMTFKTFSFTGTPSACTLFDNVYVKTNGTEMLILELNTTPLTNIESLTDANGNYIPTLIPISGNNKITYRNYSGTVALSTICTDIAPATPTVVEQWTGSGTISVITTKNTPVAGQPVGYQHSITIVDVSFAKGDETVRIQDNDFGAITTNLGFTFAFVPGPLAFCSSGTPLYSVDNTEALVFHFDPAIFTNEAGISDPDIPIDATNYPILRVFNTSVATGNICSGDGPQISETERWNGTQGTIHVVTVFDAISNNYKHSIYFKDLKMYKAGTTSSEFFTPVNNVTIDGVDYYYYGDYQP